MYMDHPVESSYWFCTSWSAGIAGNLCNYRVDARPVRSVPSRKFIESRPEREMAEKSEALSRDLTAR